MKLNKKHLIPVVLLLVMSIFLSGCRPFVDTSKEFEVKTFLARAATDSTKLESDKIKKLYAYPILADNGVQITEEFVVLACKKMEEFYAAHGYRSMEQKFNYDNAVFFIDGDKAIIEGAVLKVKGIKRIGNRSHVVKPIVEIEGGIIELKKVNNQWKIANDVFLVIRQEDVASIKVDVKKDDKESK